MTEQRIKLIKGTCKITVEPHQVAFWKAEGFAIVEPHYRLNALAMPAYAVLPDGWQKHDAWTRCPKCRSETDR